MPNQQIIIPQFGCCGDPLEFIRLEAKFWQKYIPWYASCNQCGTRYEVNPTGHLFRVTPDNHLCCAETSEDPEVAIIETVTEPGDVYREYYPYCRTHEHRPPNSVDYNPEYEYQRLRWFTSELFMWQMHKNSRLH